MNVIKESHESIMRRKNLNAEKQRILNMDFKKKSHRKDWEQLNQFLEEKKNSQSANASSLADNAATPIAGGQEAVVFSDQPSTNQAINNEAEASAAR